MFNILIMDSVRSNRQKIRHYLDDLKIEFSIVGEVASPEQAERLLISRSVDLIIGDDAAIGKTGLQVFKNHQESLPNLHAILFTNSAMFSESKETMAAGRLDYLTKPIRKNDVINSVRRMALRIDDVKIKETNAHNLRDNYETQLELFKERFLMNLIYGSVRQTSYIYSQLTYFRIPYNKAFTVAIFKIDDYRRYQLALEEDDKQFLIYKVYSLIQQSMMDTQAGIAFISRYDEVTLLYSAMDAQMDIMEHCVKLHAQINESLELQGTVGIGRTYDNPQEIHLSYRQAVDAVLEHNYLGKDTVIHIDFVIGKNDLAYIYGPEQEGMIIKYAINGQLDHCLKSLRKVLSALNAVEGYSQVLYQAFVKKLLAHLYRDGLVYDYNLEAHLKTKMPDDGLGLVADETSTYDYLKTVLTLITDYVKEMKVTQDQLLLEEALKYVQAYYTSRISLTSAAQYLMTTPKHLETIIYSVYEKSFYDFCMMVRVENAKDLLIKTRQSTADVATAVGFTNTEYFIAIFKQVTKITPSEYRHLNKNTSEPPIQLVRPTSFKKYYN